MGPRSAKSGRWLVVLGVLLLAACSSTPPRHESPVAGHYKLGNPYQIAGRWYYPSYDPGYAAVGVASWYGDAFHGRATANGELFDRNRISAAHPTLPLPSIVRVTNLANQRQLEVRVNDRGPFVGDRVIDLSQAAARELGFEQDGLAEVRVEFVRLADAAGTPPEPTVTPPEPTVPPPVRAVAQAAPPQPVRAPSQAAAAPPTGEAQIVRIAATQDDGLPAARRSEDATHKRCLGFIQVGAFAEPERALRLAKELDAAAALPVSAEPPSADRYARVRLGPIVDPGQIEAALRWLHQIGYGNAFLVKPDVTSSVAC